MSGNSSSELVFGFLPPAVLQNINEVGNWKTRSNAIEQVQRGLQHLGPAQTNILQQQLPEFAAFTLQLLSDHNFKVVTAGLSVLADAARTLGQALQQHMSEVLPVLLTRLMDHRTPVAAAAFQAAASIMQHTHSSNPAAFANKLLLLQQHEAMGKGQDCSGLLELLILAILKGPVSSLDLPAAMRLLLKSMQRSSSDGDSSSSKQHALAMEAFALATDNLGSQLPNLMKQAGGTDLQVTQVLMQVQRMQRPQLGPGGMSIQHSSATQAAIAAAEAAAPGGSSFKIGASLYDRTNNSSHASSFNSESSFGLGSLNLGGNNSSSKGLALGNAATEALRDSLNAPLGSAWSQDQQHQQMLPPGSLGALAAHAQLISSASSSAAAAAAASNAHSGSGAGGSRPVSGLASGRGQLNNPGQDSRYSNKLQLSLSSGSVGAEQQHYTAGRSPLGSPRALPAAANSHSHLQPQSSRSWRDDSGIAMLQASSSSIGSAGAGQQISSRTQSQQQDHLQDQLSNLHMYDSSRYAGSRQDGQSQHSTPAAAGDAATAGRRQQAEADSAGIDWSHGGSQQAGLQAMPTLNLRYQQPGSMSNSSGSGLLGRRSTAEQARGLTVDAAATHHAAIAMPAQAGTGSGSSSSWLAAAGPGWAPSDPAGLEPTANPYSPGRAETLSPSRGERLAQLKRRQVEKRAVSATGSTRGSTPWDSQDGTLAGALTAPPLAGSAEGLGPRAVTAGPFPAGALGWRGGSGGADSPSSTGLFGYGASSSPAPAEEAGSSYASGSGSSVRGGHGSLLQWHIPTGPGGRVLPLGSAGSGVVQYHPQQHQQQQSLHPSSPEPNAGHSRSQGSYSPTNSWDSSSGLASGRAFQSSTGSAPATGSPKMGPLLQNVPRTVSAAAVLMNAPVDTHTASSSNADGGGPGYRSSRFQQVRSGSSSPAPAEAGASGQATGLPAGSSRLHGSIGSAAGASAGFNRQQQQGVAATRAQTAAPAVGISAGSSAGYSTAQQAPSEWGTGSSSSPTGRLGGVAGGLNSSSGSAGPGPGSMSAAGSPTRSPGGLSGRVGSGLHSVPGGGERPQSSGVAEVDLAGADLAPLQDPEAGLRHTIAKLQQANVATRKEIDWQAQLDALTDARRLLAHHLDVMRPSARELVLSALPAVDELRSTTARMALLFFQELPSSGLSMERELDEVVPVLLKKAGDLSTAGRDNFLAQEAAKALSAICAAVSESRALSALIAAGANHKSPHVRTKTAALLDEVVAGGAGLEPLLRNGNWAVLDKVFKTAAGMLQDGSLDTRTYAKRLLWGVKAALRGNRPDMDRLMAGITPEGVHRRVVEVLELPAPPPPPANRNAAGSGARLASRSGQPSGCSTPTSGLQPAPPFSAPPAMLTAAGAAAGGYGYDGPASAQRPGYSSVGSTSGGSGGAARRALFSGGSGNSSSSMSAGLQVHGAGAAASGSPGSPGSPTVSGSQRRRSTASAVAEGGRALGSASPCSSGAGAGGLGGVGSRSGGDRRVSGGGCPAGPPGPMSAELQEAVDQVGLQLCSKDWRSRMDALRALSALGPALPEVPNPALEGLLQALTGRLNDGNAKVNQKALEVLCEVVYAISLRVVLIMPSLMPALTANLGSTNDKLRGCASSALNIIASAVAPQPQLLIQGLAQAVSNGSVRTKIAVIEKLGMVLPALHQSQPQLTRLLLPAAFSLVQEARGDAKAAAAQLMGLLGSLLGSTAVLSAAANVSSATEQRARELMFGGAVRS